MNSDKLYGVSYIVGPGPKFGQAIILAQNIEAARQKATDKGLDVRGVWTWDFEEDN